MGFPPRPDARLREQEDVMEFLMLCLPFGVAGYGLFRLIRLWREGEEREMRLDDACKLEMLQVAAAHLRADLMRSISRDFYTSSPTARTFYYARKSTP